MPENKKLIEVSLPLDAINAQSAREKSIRHGHPSTLHLWWSRKPLGTARAVLFASLVDDPSSRPEKFPTEEAQVEERERLHKLLSELVKWENRDNRIVLDEARAEIKKSMGAEKLVFLDPFAGGGSIPLEAQRLGLEANAHDLNPVAVVINKAMIEIPPKFADQPPVNPEGQMDLRGRTWSGTAGLAEDVRYYSKWMKEEAFRRIGMLYPMVKLPDGKEAVVIAWIWARTVKCPNPACGCEMPLASSFVLSKKKGNEAWVEPVIEGKNISYTVHSGKCPTGRETNKLAKGASFRCPVCGAVTDKKYIHDQFIAHKKGMVLIATVAEGQNGRIYLSADAEQARLASSAVPNWEPAENMNTKCADLVSGRGYGITQWKQLFTPRQLTALGTFSELVGEAQAKAEADAVLAGLPDDGIGLAKGGKGARAYGEAIGVYLAFVVDRLANKSGTMCVWNRIGEKIEQVFSRQAIPLIWEFPETNVFSNSSGCFDNMADGVIKCIWNLPASSPAYSAQKDAQSPIDLKNVVISTDPPYYDNIGYADLSDYFYIWMRASLKKTYPELFRTILVPKAEELVATPCRFDGDKRKAKEFFEAGMFDAFRQMNKAARSDVPVTIYYAFKQSETDKKQAGGTVSTGWETMLSALIKAGFAITGTWPLHTERETGLKDKVNALASSIVLVCRQRPVDAQITTRRAFLTELKKDLPPAIRQLQEGNIAPVDMAQAAIGPGMAIFSKYSQVLEADGAPMGVRAALLAINAELDSYLAGHEGSMDEASRFCLDLYSQAVFNAIRFGEADVLARARNTSVEGLEEIGVLRADKGLVRLTMRDELPEKPKQPAKLDSCLWLLTQYLVKAIMEGGINACVQFARQPNAGEARNLAYRLFALAERKKLSSEAFAYNSLVTAWPEIMKLAAQLKRSMPEEQGFLMED